MAMLLAKRHSMPISDVGVLCHFVPDLCHRIMSICLCNLSGYFMARGASTARQGRLGGQAVV